MKLRTIAMACLASAFTVLASAADFSVQFDPSYTASAHPNVTFTGTIGSTGLAFHEGTSVSLLNTINSSIYTLDTQFSFDVTEYWRKVIDFKDRSSDNGLYIHDGHLSLASPDLSESTGPVMSDGQTVRLTLTRDSGKLFTAYINGIEQLSLHDTHDITVFDAPSQIARLFIDDLATFGYERSPGTVKYIKTFDRALSPTEVSALGNVSNVPEPETLALSLAGLLVVAGLTRRPAHFTKKCSR